MTDEHAPIQAAVEEPILNSPFYEPKYHWIYNREGHAIKAEGRRPAQYHYLTQRTGSAQETLPGIGADEGADDLPLVNRLREDVRRWRDSGYENATQVTKQLLRHWWRKDRTRRLFFCQLEAVETVIYLTEVLESGRKPRWKPRVTVEDFQRLCQGEQPRFVTEDRVDPLQRETQYPTLIDQPWDGTLKPLRRYGCKMATGSGKTVVMAMLIAWTFCNRGRVSGDTRFPNAVLVACPNLTVKERLQVLRPERPGNYYYQFDLVPSTLRPLLNQGKVLIHNWHQFADESPHAEGGSTWRVVDKGEESPEAFAKRVLRDLAGCGPIMVLNDEAHHAYRPARPDQAELNRKDEEDLEFGLERTEDRNEATVWVGGLGVVSVQMLTEGWDANNVTHILGLRAFGSQLLCEQVVGRGLRRMNYDFDPETEKLSPEYVDVFGIPFSVIPYRGRKTTAPAPEDKPKNHVKALPERKSMAIRFPIVEGYVMDLKNNFITADVASVAPVTIEPIVTPTEVFVQPQVGIKEGRIASQSFETEKLDRQEYYEENHLQTIKFEIARQIVLRLTETSQAGKPKLQRRSRHQLFPQVYRLVDELVATRVNWNGIDPRELGLEVYARQIVERLTDAIEPDETKGEAPLLPILNRFRPYGSSADVNFITTRKTHPTRKSHIDQVVLDTGQWEQSATFYLEANDAVLFYARNDHMDMAIPYEFLGGSHHFFPDFLVRLTDGTTLVLEIKGRITAQEEAKFEAAKRWVAAVNNWGRLRRWEFILCDDPQKLPQQLTDCLNRKMVA